MRSDLQRNIVVWAARSPSPARDRLLLEALSREPDWDAVIRLAEEQGVAPLLADTLESAPLKRAVPMGVRRELSAVSLAAAVASNRLLTALEGVLREFDSRTIEAVVLKGPVLATTLYPDAALRPSKDLDLLCRAHTVDAAVDALRALGYAQREQKVTEQDGFHLVFQSTGGVEIELHTDLLQLGLPARCSTDLWEHLSALTIRGAQARMLSPEYQMLHLSVHLHTHGYSRLIWFKDLDLLLRRSGGTMNWELVHALAAREGATLSLRHSLTLLRELLGTPLPSGALAGIVPDPLGAAAHAVIWPRREIVALRSKQRLRSLRFNPRLGPMGVLPNMVVMGRRREKLAALMRQAGRAGGKQIGEPSAS